MSFPLPPPSNPSHPLPPPMAIAPLFNSYDPLGVGFVSVGSIGMREVVVGGVGWVGGKEEGISDVAGLTVTGPIKKGRLDPST